MSIYTVRSGDTLGRIARRHGVSLDQLLDLNPQIENPNIIHPGDTINLSRIEDGGGARRFAEEDENLIASPVPWFEIAKREEAEGVDEIRGARDNPRIVEYHQSTTLRASDDETPWCSSFVNWCVEQAGLQGTGSAAARSWLRWGQSLTEPHPGCIVVLRRGTNPAHGHVGFYVDTEGNRVRLLGGNQGNRVSISSYPKEKILGYRWPTGIDVASDTASLPPAESSSSTTFSTSTEMISPASYNRRALGKYWNLTDIPGEWDGYTILLKGDHDRDRVIEEEEMDDVDWLAFSEAVEVFQRDSSIDPIDAKLGPDTVKRLRESFGIAPSNVLRQIGDDLVFHAAEVPLSEPPGPDIVGYSPEERRICNLWNRYGKAIFQQAQANGLSTESALAVFFVESGTAYHSATGLLMIRYEPHIFRGRSGGHEVSARRGTQQDEWENLERAYHVDKNAALLSCSYGLPQLMGFNWRVTTHQDPRSMVMAFQRSCEEQVAGFFGYVRTNNLARCIERNDWREFTRRYNGAGNVEEYSGRIRRALRVIDSLREDGNSFEL